MRRISDFLKCKKEIKDNCELRSTPSGFDIAIFNSIKVVPQQDWNSIVPEERGLMRQPYLIAIENSINKHEQSRYALMYKNGVPVAVAIFRIVLFSGEDYRTDTSENGKLDKLKNTLKDKTKLRVLVCGHTHISGDHGFIHSSAVSSNEAYHALVEACENIKNSGNVGKIDLQLIKDFYEDEFTTSGQLEVFKYRRFQVDPNMILNLRPEWEVFEDYLNAMNTKYRKKALSTIKQGAVLERRSLSASEIEKNIDKIQHLYFNVASKAKFRINHFDASYLLELKRNLKEDFRLVGYYLEEEMIGFNTILFWGGNCEAHSIGINYDFNNQYAIYQNMLYDDVKMAIEHNSKKLILGRTAMEMKSNFGAVPYEMCCYVRHSGSILNSALKPVFSYIKQTEWTQRSPFKELAANTEVKVLP